MKVIGYRQAHDSYTTADLDPAFVRMPLSLSRDDRFFIFGSCTARQMERALRLRGIDVLSVPPATPSSEMLTGTSVVDRYRVPVIEQELAWALDGVEFPVESLIDMPRGLCVDPQLPYARSVDRDRALQRRDELKTYFARVREATAFVIDLCLTDGFFDRETGLVLNAAPPDWYADRFPDRFEYQIWEYEDCVAALRRLCARLLNLGPDRRIVLTVNAVPIRRAISPSDATRETVRKASLWMTAVEQIAAEFPNVASYPMFEALTSHGEREWLDEFNHVREDVMDRLVAAMLHAFGIYITSVEQHAGEHDAGEAPPSETAADIDLASLGARVAATLPDRAPTVRRFAVDVEVTNVGSSTLQSAGRYPVSVCYRWYDATGALQEIGKSLHTSLPAPLQPGESATIKAVIATPTLAGKYTLALTLVKHEIAWLDDLDAANGQRSDILVEAWDAGLPD